MPREVGQPGQGRVVTLRECDLKLCELCGWLNLKTNDECFVCGWRGHFERDPKIVHAALEMAIREHGRVELKHLTNVADSGSTPNRRLTARFIGWIRGLFARFRRRRNMLDGDMLLR